MPPIGRKFGSGEGVPRKDLALAALGVGESREKSLESREGGLDEIVLSAQEQSEAEKQDVSWSQEQLYAWGEQIGWSREFVDLQFEIINNEVVGKEEGGVFVDRTNITVLPPNLKTSRLIANGTEIKHIPWGLRADVAAFSDTNISEIPPGLQVRTLYIAHTAVKDLPDDLGMLQELILSFDQKELKMKAKERGLKVKHISMR